MRNLSFIIFIYNKFLINNIFCSLSFVINFIVLFGFINLFGFSIFINNEYISLSTIPVVVYLKVDKKNNT